MRSVLMSVLVIGVAAAMLGAGTMAYFSDTEKSGQNIVKAGTLDLKVSTGDSLGDDPYIVTVTLGDVKPGDGTIGWGAGHPDAWYWTVKNVGSLPGVLTITVDNIVNYEYGRNEPEIAVDSTGGNPGADNGELGSKIRIQVYFDGIWVYETGNLNALEGVDIVPGFGGAGDPFILDSNEEATLNINWSVFDTAGNEIQSDSVEFDIIFHLEQVVP